MCIAGMYLRFTKDYFVSEYVEEVKNFLKTKQLDWPVCMGREKKREKERETAGKNEVEGERGDVLEVVRY